MQKALTTPKYWLMLCVLSWVCLPRLSQAQVSSTVGKEFYAAFMPNRDAGQPSEMSVHITAEVTTSGRIEVIGTNWSQQFTINAGNSRKIQIPDEFKFRANGVHENRGVYISTVEDVTVYAYNFNPGSSDGTILLPLPALDKEYMIHVKGNETQFAVLATDNNTTIEVKFNSDQVIDNVPYAPGDVLNYELNRGDVVLLQSRLDLTSTEVSVVNTGAVDCKKIAVFVANGPDADLDLNFNQLNASRDWGREYFALLFEEPRNEGTIEVLAAHDNTRLNMSGVPPRTLMKGETFTVFAEIEHYIQSDKPISVVHTGGVEVMNLLIPLRQISENILFEVIGTPSITEYYLTILTPSDRMNVSLDGVNITDQFEPVQLANQYSFAVIEMTSGVHRLRANNGAVAFAYGFGSGEGFAYAIGGELGNFEISLENLGSSLPDGQACVGHELRLLAETESLLLTELYTEFRWDMGDGTILEGPEVFHQYTTPGEYEIVLFASKSPLACSDLSVTREIEIIGAAIDDIAGPEALCPNVGPVAYELTGTEPDYTYAWFVEGGTIDSQSGAAATVSWTYGAPVNRLKAVSTSPLGCVSDTVFLDVQYNVVLEPTSPLGPEFICGDFVGITYYVPPTTGSVYTWIVEGGRVVSGQGSAEIVVDWDGPGNHRLWYTESSTTLTDLCEGTSEVLDVVVSESMDISLTSTPVSCFGQNDGAVSVSVSGGVGPYTVEWSIGSTESAITGLAGGDYEVVITDGAGCQVTRVATIEEPAALEGHVVVTDAACSNNTGLAQAVVTGGSGTYRYLWQNELVANDTRSGLGGGTYSVTVVDENGCELVMNYEIRVPQPMTASFEQERPCPDTPEGKLRILVSGGSGPYTYSWDMAPTVDTEEAEDLLSGRYQVVVTDAEGCRLSVTAELTNIEPLITMPNTFSPNGDGWNDQFQAVFNCATDFSMYIYNQWGNVIFASSDIARGWDGTYKGEPVPIGDYAYHIIYSSGPDRAFKESIKGNVRVIR